ncbi:hypothetical protein K3181_10225 [Qipengyuania sp. YG27]|uniref:Uncharacterized protein n=1 Tax=Qipengyuania mesophila TaxID=2867246 RepID=A0ABS7JW47_9SPHN|nr:hypothetical protein [Qipengyuania mesophila]MBX7501816.1 hypothetical protein [Qipengyuania mesophila]
MQIDPQIGALRGDHAAQRVMREAVVEVVRQCRDDPALAPVLTDLEAYGAGAFLSDCTHLATLFAAEGNPRRAIEPFVRRLVGLQRAYPLAQLAFRHQSGSGFHYLQIARKGRATLGFALYDRGAPSFEATSATFPDAERHDVVLAGAGEFGLLEIASENGADATIVERRQQVGEGRVIALCGPAQSHILRAVRGRLLILCLIRFAEAPRPTRRFALPSGNLLHRASGDRRESQHELMMALLGRMGRSDAVPVLADLALDGAGGSEHFRWQALRECLALDTAAGFRVLSSIAKDPADALSGPARNLRAGLVETHPRLANLEPEPCLA